MRIALIFPNYWPYVRRGAERLMAEYAQYLVEAGHEVHIVTSKPGRRRISREGGLTVFYERRLGHPVLTRYRFGFRFYSFSLTLFTHLLRWRYDVLHLWLYTCGLPARMNRLLYGTPYVYQSMAGALTVPSRLDQWLFNRVVPQADRVAALTPRLAREASEALNVPVEVLPACVDMDTFKVVGRRDLDRPQVLFVSDLRDYRKGFHLLLMAWGEVHRQCPEARLIVAGPSGQEGFSNTVGAKEAIEHLVSDSAARSSIDFVGVGRLRDLPRRYSRACVTVLPSMDEAFGLVMVESLACGTPVVGNALEGPGEIITDPSIGETITLRNYSELSNPARAAQLAHAILRAIDLARTPATAARCREHASQWAREKVGRKLERLYGELAGVTELAAEMVG